MKKISLKTTAFITLLTALGAVYSPVSADAATANDDKSKLPVLTINGTGQTATIEVNSQYLLNKDINVRVPYGFEVAEKTLQANGKTKLAIKLVSSKDSTSGNLILRNGDYRKYVKLIGLGSPLQKKSLAASGKGSGKSGATLEKAFKPGANGYTIEFKLKSMEDGQVFSPWFVDAKGYGFKAYVDSKGVGLYNSKNKKGISNPANDGVTGGGKFYNNDGNSHTYRIAVTPDNRAFIYRDGQLLSLVRVDDYGPQPNFATGKGKMTENLLRNGNFEGEFELRKDASELAGAIQGWDIVIGDKWNSEQKIQTEELDNEYDKDNHVFMLRPYKWASGWSDGILQQVIDVQPNETYTLTVMAKGGQDEGKNGGNTGKLGIEELQDNTKKNVIPITSTEWETYSVDYTTSADCHQIVVRFSDGRGGWGNKIKPIYVDNAVLTGVSRTYKPRYGYENQDAKVEYFTIDESGAYAPEAVPEIDLTF